MTNALRSVRLAEPAWEAQATTAVLTAPQPWASVAVRPALPDFPKLSHRREIGFVVAASVALHFGLFAFLSQQQQPSEIITPPEVPPMVVEFAPPPPAAIEPPPKLETPPKIQPKAPPPPEAINPLPQPVVQPTPPAPAEPVVQQPAPPVQRELPPPPVATTPPLAYADYLRNPAPVYPELAERRGWEGSVLLRVLVLANGSAGRVEVEKSSGKAVLDKAALDAVRNWRFVPSKRGTTAVDGYVSVPIDFNLR